jgi:hypothetical protein
MEKMTDPTAELRVPDSISRLSLDHIYPAIRNLNAGVVGDEFDPSEVADLLNDPCAVVEPPRKCR